MQSRSSNSNITIARIATAFLERSEITAGTRRNYQSHLGRFVRRHGSEPIALMERASIEAYLQSLQNLAYTTHRAHQRSLKALFAYAMDRGYVERNPVTGIPPRKPDAEKGEHYDAETIRYFSEPELQLLFSALQASCNVRLKLLVVLLYRTGCRVSEVLGLDRADLDLKTRSFTVIGKGNKVRICYYADLEADATDWAISLLAEYLEYYHEGQHPALLLAEDPVRRQVGRLSYAQAIAGWRDLVDAVPQLKGSRLHDLRHTFGTERVGIMPIEELRALMGHSNVATTLRYAKVTPQRAAGSARQAISQVSRF